MMGCGKSTIGNIFANKLGYRFLDTDEIAEYMIEMPISDFFNQGREDEFRQLESEILMQMVQYTRVVISTGGGIVMKNENWGKECLNVSENLDDDDNNNNNDDVMIDDDDDDDDEVIVSLSSS
jgi:shikimate kinase